MHIIIFYLLHVHGTMIIPRFTLFQPKNAFICLCQRSLFCCRRHAYVSTATEMMVFGCNTKIRTGYIVAFLSSSHSPFFRFHMFSKECRFHVYLVETEKRSLNSKQPLQQGLHMYITLKNPYGLLFMCLLFKN